MPKSAPKRIAKSIYRQKSASASKRDISRTTGVLRSEEEARDERHKAAEDTTIAVRRRSLDTKLAVLQVEKDEEYAKLLQDQEISNERARILSEKQRFIIDKRWEVEQEEITKEQALEQAKIQKDAAVIEEAKLKEAADIRRALAREQEERDRDIALLGKAEELDSANSQRNRKQDANDRNRQVGIIAIEEEVRRAEVRQALAIELEEREREIALINKESERELADIGRYLAREKEERDREITLAGKLRELEAAEIKRLETTAEREQAEHGAESVRIVADAEREKEIHRITAEREATARRIDEENKAEITRMHMLTQSEARKLAAEQEAEATLTRAKATSEAQKITADGIEREAGATGRAEMEIETLRTQNVQRRLEAEAAGIESKADALKQYNESAAFLELAQLHISAERDIHIDQAKAMGSALSQAQIRMYGGGGAGGDGTVDTIRGMFTSGFALGEVLEGVAQSLPEGLRSRFSENGIRGLFGKPQGASELRQSVDSLTALVRGSMRTRKDRDIPFVEAVAKLEEAASDDASAGRVVSVLRDMNENGMFDEVKFEQVWALLQAATKNGG